jgi:hypothetical protein
MSLEDNQGVASRGTIEMEIRRKAGGEAGANISGDQILLDAVGIDHRRAEESKATDDRNARSARSVRVKRQEDATDARYRKGGRRVEMEKLNSHYEEVYG